jgi:hypothetical protein
MRKKIRKLAVRMHLKRSSWEQVKMAWRVAFLTEEKGYLPFRAARKADPETPYRASMAHKQYEKFKNFALKGIVPDEVEKFKGGRIRF